MSKFASAAQWLRIDPSRKPSAIIDLPPAAPKGRVIATAAGTQLVVQKRSK